MRKSIILLWIVALCAGVASAAGRYRGDLNGDDQVDLADMVYLAKAIQSGTTDSDCDINASGKVDDYDLQALANIILSGQLTDNDGFNVGIGGWDDSGEDYGGVVGAPSRKSTRSGESIRFYIGNPREESTGKFSMELGIEEADVAAAAILFNIKLPNVLSFSDSDIVKLESSVLNGHKFYGNPRITQTDEWSDKTLRFIIFTPDLQPLKISTGVLGRIYYGCNNDDNHSYEFSECQIATSDGNVADAEYSSNWMPWKPVAVNSVNLDPSDIEVYVDDEREIWSNIEPWEATDKSLTWKSSDESVVAITFINDETSYIRIKALKKGTATITATATNGVEGHCNITVNNIEVSSIWFDYTDINMRKGDQQSVNVNIDPWNASDRNISWNSSDASIVSVTPEESGSTSAMIKALKTGSATVTATASNGLTASFKVNITQLATGISLDNTDVTLKLGETIQLKATISPDDTSDKTIEWSSSDSSVASVNSDGLVTALKTGNATITVATKDGSNLTATTKVYVNPILAESISIEGMPDGDIHIGDNFRLTAKVLPSNTTDPSVSWSSGNPSVASVDADGTVRALAEGEAVIAVKTSDGSNLSASVMVAVKPILANSIVITQADSEIRIGETVQLTATVYPDNTTNKNVTWSSGNTAVASVNSSGLVTALAVGEATITATASDGSGMTATAKVKVNPILAESISIEGMPDGDIHIGDNFRLTAKVLPSNTTDPSVSWSSGNPSVASVDADGTVRALAEGEAVIAVKTNDGSNLSANVTIVVKPNLADRIVIDPSDSEIRIGETVQLTATVYPDNTTDKNVTWSSGNTAVATVNSSGLVTALAVGEAIITATASDGSGLTATAKVKVNPILAESISIEGMPDGDIHIGDNFRLTAKVLPSNTTDPSVSWSSGNPSVASVDADGTVRALTEGEAVVTVKTNDGSNLSANVTIVVKPNLADRIVIDPSDSEIRIGETVQLTATVYPDNTTNKNVVWSCLNPDIATVDANGIVTALSIGEATIIATASDGSGISATAIVKVIPTLVENIYIDGLPDGDIIVGDKFKLIAIVTPEDAADTSVSWSSDDESLASVDENGNVEILAEGSIVIRARANDESGCEAYCLINAISGVECLIDDVHPFKVFDINGHLILNEATRNDLNQLAKGIFILVQGNSSRKFIR